MTSLRLTSWPSLGGHLRGRLGEVVVPFLLDVRESARKAPIRHLLMSCRVLVRQRRLECRLGDLGFGGLDQRVAQRGLVADHDRVDVAMGAGELDGGADFRLVAGDPPVRIVRVGDEVVVAVAREVVVEPDAERHPQAELGRDRRHLLHAAGRPVGADRVGVGRDRLEVGADLRRRRRVLGLADAFERRVRDAGQRLVDIGSGPGGLEKSPQTGMQARCKRDHGCDGAH